MRWYANELNGEGKLYISTIWEYEDDETARENESSKWAKGKLVELNASYKPGKNKMRFYIKPH